MPQQSDLIEQSSATAARRRSMAVWIWSCLLIADTVMLTHRTSDDVFSFSPFITLVSTTVIAIASWVACNLFSGTVKPSSVKSYRTWIRIVPKLTAIFVTQMWVAGVSTGSETMVFSSLSVIALVHGLAVFLNDSALPEQSSLISEIDSRDNHPLSDCQSECPKDVNPVPADSHEICHLETLREPDSVNHDEVTIPKESIDVALISANEHHATEDDEFEPDLEDQERCDDDNQTLWLSRRLTDDGELIEGWVRIQFVAGQRETLVHVAFCPPLAGNPELETEDLDGVGLEIRVAAVFPFGARISVRRSGSLDERHLDRVGFVAHSQSNRRAA
jgi:hypothetical protein